MLKDFTERDYQKIISDFNKHVVSRQNPHGVTKEQVGLANVDNTADIDKPISSLQNIELNTKLDKAVFDSFKNNIRQTIIDIMNHSTRVREGIVDIVNNAIPNELQTPLIELIDNLVVINTWTTAISDLENDVLLLEQELQNINNDQAIVSSDSANILNDINAVKISIADLYAKFDYAKDAIAIIDTKLPKDYFPSGRILSNISVANSSSGNGITAKLEATDVDNGSIVSQDFNITSSDNSVNINISGNVADIGVNLPVSDYINKNEIGAPNGVCDLDNTGVVPIHRLPTGINQYSNILYGVTNISTTQSKMTLLVNKTNALVVDTVSKYELSFLKTGSGNDDFEIQLTSSVLQDVDTFICNYKLSASHTGIVENPIAYEKSIDNSSGDISDTVILSDMIKTRAYTIDVNIVNASNSVIVLSGTITIALDENSTTGNISINTSIMESGYDIRLI